MFGIFKKKKSVKEMLEEREKYLATEKPFMTIDLGTRKAPIKPSDIQFVSMIMAFVVKNTKMSEEEAIDYSILTFVLTKDGAEQEKKDANTTADSAFKWSFEQSLDGIEFQLLCGEKIKHHLLNPTKVYTPKQPEFKNILLKSMLAMAGADGEVSPDEFVLMKNTYQTITKTKISDTEFSNVIEQVVQDMEKSNEGLLDCLHEHKESLTPKAKEMILTSIVVVAASDGNITEDEKKVIGEVGTLLQFEILKFKEILANAMVLAGAVRK